jgi:hypothetical protein
MSSFVPILDGTNYPQWARRMAALLVNMELDDVAGFDPRTYVPDITPPSLSSKTDNDTILQLTRRDLKAKGVIEITHIPE